MTQQDGGAPENALSVLHGMSAASQGIRTGTLVVVSSTKELVSYRVWCALVDGELFLAVAQASPASRSLHEDGRVCLLLEGAGPEETVTGAASPASDADLSRPALQRLAAGPPAARQIFRVTPLPVAPLDALEDPADRRLMVQHIFSDLPRTVAGVMARRLRYQMFGPGDIVIQQGTEGDHFFIVVDGEVEVVREDAHSGAELLTTLGPGESFGETA
ncbi:MAG TPA: cyclic nucleotide-binding domain-containing protein, partial [Chloroflexota bacterium]|nr:cyclic nucleotide-binding domain-containing protein [Chloroflexota bacterium]